jgi:hypothetical protein
MLIPFGPGNRFSYGCACIGPQQDSPKASRSLACFALLAAFSIGQARVWATDMALGLPELVEADSELDAAVFRSSRRELVLHERGQVIESGRWQLHSVSSDSVLLVAAGHDDPESGTKVRVYEQRSARSPIVIRSQPPDQPPAPRLVIQAATIKSAVDNSGTEPEKFP